MNALKSGVSRGDQGTKLVRVDVVLVWPGADTVGQRSIVVVPNGDENNLKFLMGLIWEVSDHQTDQSFSPWDSESAIKGQRAILVDAPVLTLTQLVLLENTSRSLCWALNTALSSYLALTASSLSNMDYGLKAALWHWSKIKSVPVCSGSIADLQALQIRDSEQLSPRLLSPLSPFGFLLPDGGAHWTVDIHVHQGAPQGR